MDTSDTTSKRTQSFRDALTDLTVILGRSQVLRRRIQHGHEVSSDAVVQSLNAIETAGWSLSGHMRAAEDVSLRMEVQLSDLHEHLTHIQHVLDDTDQHSLKVRAFLNNRPWDQVHEF
jgi:hypothetical protein